MVNRVRVVISVFLCFFFCSIIASVVAIAMSSSQSLGPTPVARRKTPWSNLLVGAAMNIFQGKIVPLMFSILNIWSAHADIANTVTSLGQPMEVIKTHVSNL